MMRPCARAVSGRARNQERNRTCPILAKINSQPWISFPRLGCKQMCIDASALESGIDLEVHDMPRRVVACDEPAHGRYARLVERRPQLRSLACKQAVELTA